MEIKKYLAPEAAVVAERNILKYLESQNVIAGRDHVWELVTENTEPILRSRVKGVVAVWVVNQFIHQGERGGLLSKPNFPSFVKGRQ